MKNTIIAAVMAAGLTTAIPAMAQDYRGDRAYGQDRDYHGREHHRRTANLCEGERAKQLYARLRHEVKQRDIDWRRARDLRAAVDRTAEVERRFCARGMNDYQAARITRQYDSVEAMIRREGRG
jgi:hypothetical protein